MSSEENHDVQQEIERVFAENKLSGAQKKKKLILFCIRTSIAIVLYVLFWEHAWVHWTLVVYVPLALLNIVFLLGFNSWMERRKERLLKKAQAQSREPNDTEGYEGIEYDDEDLTPWDKD